METNRNKLKSFNYDIINLNKHVDPTDWWMCIFFPVDINYDYIYMTFIKRLTKLRRSGFTFEISIFDTY